MTLARRTVVSVVVALAGPAVWPGAAVVAAPSNAAQAWYRHVVNDLHPLQSTLLGALDAASGWATGSESATKARREFERDLPTLERVHHALEKLAPLQGHTSARDDYVAAIGLYVASLQMDEAATEEPSGALQEQLQHSYQRIRSLGDIVFDQGTAELAPELGSGLAGPDVAAATHVPDWSSDGLAPAPPLAPLWHLGGTPAGGSQPKGEWAAENRDGRRAGAVRSACRRDRPRTAVEPREDGRRVGCRRRLCRLNSGDSWRPARVEPAPARPLGRCRGAHVRRGRAFERWRARSHARRNRDEREFDRRHAARRELITVLGDQ